MGCMEEKRNMYDHVGGATIYIYIYTTTPTHTPYTRTHTNTEMHEHTPTVKSSPNRIATGAPPGFRPSTF